MKYIILLTILNYEVHGSDHINKDQYTRQHIESKTSDKTQNPPIQKHISKNTTKKKHKLSTFNPMNDAPKSNSGTVTSFRGLVNYIKSTETFQSTPYWDVKQYSIGYGTKAKHRHDKVTKAEAYKRLIAHVTPDYNVVKRLVQKSGKLNMSYVYALTDLTYNIGRGWMSGKGHSLGGYTKTGNGDGVKKKILQYNKARDKHHVLVELRGLTARRKAEYSWIKSKSSKVEPDPISEQQTLSRVSVENKISLPDESISLKTNTLTLMVKGNPISKNLKSKTPVNQTSILSYEILKNYHQHVNVHRLILSGMTSKHLELFSDKNTRLNLNVQQEEESKEIMKTEFIIKESRILQRESDTSYVMELTLMNSTVNALITKKLPHIILNSSTVYGALNAITSNVLSATEKKMILMTNASTVDYRDSVQENMFELNEGYNRFKYEQIILPQDTVFNQLDNVLNNHYNVFNVPAMWLIDDASFTTKTDSSLGLYIFDPTSTKIMVVNSFKGMTNDIGGSIIKWENMFDKESVLQKINQNFVLNKASGFFVDNNESTSTSNVILTDSVDQFNKRRQALINWVNSSPEITTVAFRGIDLTKVRHMEQYDFDNDGKYESTLLDTHIIFRRETSELTDQQTKSHNVKFVADKTCQFYKTKMT